MSEVKRILVADANEEIQEIIRFFLRSVSDFEIGTVTTAIEAMALLRSNTIDLFICDDDLTGAGNQIYQTLMTLDHKCRFVLCSADPKDQGVLVDQEYFYGHIEKPHLKKGIQGIINKLIADNAIKEDMSPESYTPISISLLARLHELPSDVYIKISEENFIKVYSRGDIFDETDWIKYSEKNIQRLFVLNFGIEKLVDKFNQKLLNIIQSSPSRQIDSALQTHDVMLKFLREFGVHQLIIETVMKHINETLDQLQQDRRLVLLLTKLLRSKESYLTKHSFLLVTISLFLAEKAGWPSAVTTQKLIYASFFHDIFLKEDTTCETDHVLSRNYDDDFILHPHKASELLRSISLVPQDTDRIILEQHEIGEELGIPRGLKAGKVTPLGQLFSFAHLVVDDILLSPPATAQDKLILLQRLEGHVERVPGYRKFYNYLKESDLFRAPN